MIKKVYITVDVEEWYDLEYLDGIVTDEEKKLKCAPALNSFLDLLGELGAKATFFCLKAVAEENPEIIRRMADEGHTVALHGYDHGLVFKKSRETFISQLTEAKAAIEAIIGKPVTGYRASCYSMESAQRDLLPGMGFTFDSSFVRFAQHDLYRVLDMSEYKRIESLVFVNETNGFHEYEIPTFKIGKINLPVSGGGYLRLYPLWFEKLLLSLYSKKEENLVLYLHPFEMTDVALPVSSRLGAGTRFRMNVGRRANPKKVRRFLAYLKAQGAEFLKMC